jgi:hypothetical protein
MMLILRSLIKYQIGIYLLLHLQMMIISQGPHLKNKTCQPIPRNFPLPLPKRIK